MSRPFVWISFVLCSLVVIGVVVQLYLIAAWAFGANGALHGGLALFVAALAAWIARREARALGIVSAQRPAVD